ncbi:hypothetical protein [Brevundimonas aurantiaca]|uniref:hypothetical protein n=1 Tax=Brevundimonas aurantiaca TaxID=74316 RepID=UPI001D184341|nr:hypothetical protein [Brevundimonas aurantiaca]MCC4295822.1 hypothetical protein [Brevundimonas aurantiaca]
MNIHPDKTAWRAVDACAGTYTAEQDATGFSRGHLTALTDALKAVQPVDALMADLLAVLVELRDASQHDEADMFLAAIAKAEAVITQATGRAL